LNIGFVFLMFLCSETAFENKSFGLWYTVAIQILYIWPTFQFIYTSPHLIRYIVLSRYAVSMLDFSKTYRIVGTKNVENDTFKFEFESEFKQN